MKLRSIQATVKFRCYSTDKFNLCEITATLNKHKKYKYEDVRAILMDAVEKHIGIIVRRSFHIVNMIDLSSFNIVSQEEPKIISFMGEE